MTRVRRLRIQAKKEGGAYAGEDIRVLEERNVYDGFNFRMVENEAVERCFCFSKQLPRFS